MTGDSSGRAIALHSANAYGREWTVTFTSMPSAFPIGSGDVDTMTVAYAGTLTGTGASASVDNSHAQQGSTPLSGTFTLSYQHPDVGASTYTTSPIPTTASAALVKSELEKLDNVGRVSVSRIVDAYAGYTWRVTFAGCRTIGTSNTEVCNVGIEIPSGGKARTSMSVWASHTPL